MGNWHVWQSLFLRSRVRDLFTVNLGFFSVVNNTSVGSKRFYEAATGEGWGSAVSVTGNRVIDPTDDAVVLSTSGPFLLVDNVFRLSDKARGVRMTWGDQTLLGNVYTRADAVEARGRYRRIGEIVVGASDLPDGLPELPATPARCDRKVFEITSGADGAAIQQAIDQAAALAGQRAVVHLPMGTYQVGQTLVIPAGCDVQLVGDGGAETSTRLDWIGPADRVVLRLRGPSRATLRDLYIHAPQARAIVVENADQPGGRVFADQLHANGPREGEPTAVVRVNGLDKSDVLLRCLQGVGNRAVWAQVIGGPTADGAKNQVSIFTGATSSAAGQFDVRQGGRLVVRALYHERSSAELIGLRLSDRGTLAIDASRFSYTTSTDAPTIAVDDFNGLLTVATTQLIPVGTKPACRFELRGDGGHASVLALNDQFWLEEPATVEMLWRNLASPPARGGLTGCNINTQPTQALPQGSELLPSVGDRPDSAKLKYRSGPQEDKGGVDEATIVRHLAPLREARVWLPHAVPDGVTDVQLHRVMATGGRGGVVEFRADP